VSSALIAAFADYLASAFSAAVQVVHGPAGINLLVDPSTDLSHVPAFEGWARDRQRLRILEPTPPQITRAPDNFRVLAVVPTYNEGDVIEHTLGYLLADGLHVYVLDNWSADGTPEIAARHDLVGLERFPRSGPSPSYDLRRILARVEDIAAHLDADWVVLHDADERRRGPWPGVGLRDALYAVDQRGFTCVDHITLTFWPTHGSPTCAGTRDVEQVLTYFEFSAHPGHFHQRRAWKRSPGQRVELAASAGHDVQFPGRRVFPYRFLLKHYPIRSQAHGERKVFAERRPRWNAAERAFGWHAQYDHLTSFERDPSELILFDPATFYEDWLMERLSGVGVFDAPPPWATPPVWRPLAPAA
jgi:glycosyltransferase involved in cell wall biosynthesis